MAALDLFPLPRLVPGRVRRWLYTSRLNGRYPGEARAQEPYLIDHPLGACMLLNRRAYEDLGGFDPRLHMYSEEIDLAIRHRAAGWECWQVPAARVVHLGGQSTRQLPDKMFVELWRSRLYTYDKYYPRLASLAVRLMLSVSQLWAILTTFVSARRQRITRRG
jgi:GT2 family glycosyltransferase